MAEFNALIQTYTVDFASNNNFLFIPAIQSDGYGSRYVIINLVSNGQPFSIPKDSVRVLIEGQKTDGTQVMDYCEIMDDETSVKVNITPQMVASPGKNKFEIAIISLTENTVLTSFPLYIMASERAFDMDQAISSDDYQVFVKYINDMDVTLSTIDEAEAARNSNEAVRQSNENKRVSAENARVSAENTRKLNETDRSNAEADRIRTEVSRVNAENTRQDNETERISNENNRKQQESSRVAAENARATAETSRAAAESGRVNAESSRVSAEQSRASAESARAGEWETLKTDVTSATNNANQAAEDLHTKAANGDFSASIDSIEVITGEPGTEATVENIGTPQNAELVFTIPRGADGKDGVDGINGKDGENGKDGVVDSSLPIEFAEAEERENIASGETLEILFGKISKAFSDLQAVAYSGSYNDLIDTPEISTYTGEVYTEVGTITTDNTIISDMDIANHRKLHFVISYTYDDSAYLSFLDVPITSPNSPLLGTSGVVVSHMWYTGTEIAHLPISITASSVEVIGMESLSHAPDSITVYFVD